MDDYEAVLRATRLDLRATVREFLATVWDPDVTFARLPGSGLLRASLEILARRPGGAMFLLEVRHYVVSTWLHNGVTTVMVDAGSSYTNDKAYTDDALNGCEDWIVHSVTRSVRRKPPPSDVLYKGSQASCCVKQTRVYKEELMARTWHPSRMVDWCLDTEEACALGNGQHTALTD